MASISIRQSIRWLPDPAGEPTSTVVLTSPQRRFVDVRIFLPRQNASSTAGASPDLSGSKIEWAFAGTSSSTPLDEPDVKGTRSKWHHWVSDRVENADPIVDEGVCVEQPNGTVLETGSMVNPDTGKVTDYEEVWLDSDPLPTALAAKPVCAVLQLHDDAAGNRGVVERLGQFCQGISRTAVGGVSVERWMWTSGSGWQQVFRSGSGPLPCKQILGEQLDLERGSVVTDKGYTWTVIEAETL